MARHRSYSITFKRQVVQEYLSGETLHSLAKRHDMTRTLIRVWIGKYEASGFDEDTASKIWTIESSGEISERKAWSTGKSRRRLRFRLYELIRTVRESRNCTKYAEEPLIDALSR
ncbi:helix-turn-helix domain containing protein [Mesorhizobium sp. M0514]|uniref:helix-turn-helix domain-containing protein n=1 Tax=Mesorhizobium sp. M0514 TaxID=2956955 RepID=UPI00333B873B